MLKIDLGRQLAKRIYSLRLSLSLALVALAGGGLVTPVAGFGQARGPYWSIEFSKAVVILAYSDHLTGNGVAKFVCEAGSDQVTVYDFVKYREPAPYDSAGVPLDAQGKAAPHDSDLELTSGDTTTTFKASVFGQDGGVGSRVVADVSARSPIMQAFAADGTITLTALGETTSPPSENFLPRQFIWSCVNGWGSPNDPARKPPTPNIP